MNLAKLCLSPIFLVLFFNSGFSKAAAVFTGKIPVNQNYTDEGMTVLSTLREPGQHLSYEVSPGAGHVSINSHDVGHGHSTDVLEITGLTAGQPYELLIKNSSGVVVDSRKFQSLNEKLENATTAVCSCTRLGILSPDDKDLPIWDQLNGLKPNAILFIGDIVYGDNAWQAVVHFLTKKPPTLEQIKQRFIDSWKGERLYRQENLIPLFSVWDDHDFGYDASDKTNPYKGPMMKLFHSYYPVPKKEHNVEFGPGVSYSFRLFGKKIVMLDNRTFSDMKNGILLGAEQVRWLERQIKSEKHVVIASGMTLFDKGALHSSVQKNAPAEWDAFRKIFSDHPVKAVFLTGDVHFSEVRRIPRSALGFETVEVVSSGIKSTSPRITPPFLSGQNSKDKDQLGYAGGRNFAILQMNGLFETLDVSFHGSRYKKAPVRIVQPIEPNNACFRYYSAAAH